VAEEDNLNRASDRSDEPEEAELLAAVRKAAGWRVSPRQLEAAQAAASSLEDGSSPERLAELVEAMRGDRSRRQSRHAELWRALGAELAVRGQPSDPASQRAFIGEARARAGRWAGDALLLRISLELAATDSDRQTGNDPTEPLEPRQVALVARWLRRRFGHRLGQLDMDNEAGPFADALNAGKASMRERLEERGDAVDDQPAPGNSRHREAGGSRERPGFRPRGAARFQGPRKRTHRRAKPAGVSRKPRKKR